MEFSGRELERILLDSGRPVERRTFAGELQGIISVQAAANLARYGAFIGVGRRNRIHYVRPSAPTATIFSGASRTTAHVRIEGRKLAPHYPLLEHRK